MLVVAVETGSLYDHGGISDQPYWFIELLAWFTPSYRMQSFAQKAKMILGDGKAPKKR